MIFKKLLIRLKILFLDMSIKKKISLLMILVAFITIFVIGITSFKISERIMEENTLISTTTLIQLASSKLKANLSSVEEISLMLLSNHDVQELINNNTTITQQLRLKERITSIMNGYIMSNAIIESIALYNYKDQTYIFSPLNQISSEQNDFIEYMHGDYIEDAIKLKGKPVWTRINNEKGTVSIIRVVNELGTHDKKGILCINVKETVFKDVSETLNISRDGALFLLDISSIPVYSEYENPRLLEHTLETERKVQNKFIGISGRDYYMISDNFPVTNWTISIYIPSKEIFKGIDMIKTAIFGAIIISLFITLITVMFISDFMTRPIISLSSIMHQVEKGDFSQRFETKNNDEIGYLGERFNSMITQIKEYIEEIYKNHDKIRENELEALQMNMNPHFLYNNLNTINWMAQDIKAEDIEVFSRALTNYYRLSLSKGNRVITIREELDQLNNYIVIQKIRYQEYIKFIIEIDEALLDCMIVKLSLQPIVENAIMHGIEGKNGKGEITIRGRIENDTIIIEIQDNGKGMDAHELDVIRNSLLKHKGIGYGLRNVDERIKLYFGEYYGIDISSLIDVGTKVVITIPIREKGSMEYENPDC